MNSNTGGFLSWQGLATYPGATAACLLITRLLHQCFPKQLRDFPEIAVAYCVALVLLLLALIALQSGPRPLDFVLCVINAVGVAVTTVGGNTLFGLTSPSARQESVRAVPIEHVEEKSS